MSTSANVAPSSSRLLPKIVHPASQLKKNGHDKITVEVRKLSSATPRSRSRPLSCPEMSIDHLINSSRIRSSRLRLRTCSARQQRSSLSAGQKLSTSMTVDELIDLLREKLQGGSYFAMRHAFTSFDPQGRGTVTREALYRLLSNFFSNTITPSQFSELLKRLGLDEKKIIPFEEFFSKFHTSSENRSHWLDPVIRHTPRKLTAGQVHNLLKDRARQNILNLSEFLPSPRGIQTLIGRVEFKNMLDTLSYHLPEEQFDILWNRYSNKGDVIEVNALLSKLGVQFDSLPRATAAVSATQRQSCAPPAVNEESSNTIPEIDKSSPTRRLTPITSKLDESRSKLLAMLSQLDKYKCGKLTAEQIRIVLNRMSISITPQQMTELLSRLGFNGDLLIDYSSLIDHFSSRSGSSLVHSILTDPHQKFYPDREKRACESVQDAENRIVTLLQDKFLNLLADFRACDPRAKGYILKTDFVSILHRRLGLSSQSGGVDIPSLTQSLAVENWVPYPKFLAMFEGQQPRQDAMAVNDVHFDLSTVQPETLKELVSSIQDIALHHTAALSHEFTCVDVCNTGRLTLGMLTELMQRFGVRCEGAEGKALWNTFVKNKDGTVDFKEFIRVFASRPNTADGHCGKKLTEDHYFMRSKTLHRDEDMILDTLRSKLVYYHSTLLAHFKSCDPEQTGYVDSNTFSAALLELCHDLTDSQLARLIYMFQDSTGLISYTAFISRFIGRHPVYRRGNDLGHLLAQKPMVYGDSIIDTKPPELVHASPTYGLPGVKATLQKQLSSQWRVLRRLLSKLDSRHSGRVSVVELRSVLHQCGVVLTSEQWFHLMEAFDSHLSGTINYKHFIDSIVE